MWLQVDERSDVLLSLRQCLQCLYLVHDEPGVWKWAILSFHSALQGAMVCHLNGSAALGALTEQSASAWLAWYEKDRRGAIKRIKNGPPIRGVRQTRIAPTGEQPPAAHLASASELFKRLANEKRRLEHGVGSIIALDQMERKAFHQLHQFRNTFTHFAPTGWSLEVAGLPAGFRALLGVLERIAGDPYPFRHMEPQQQEELGKLLAEMRSLLSDRTVQ